MITVFYDGACGLCRREIDHYQRIADAAHFQWIDITRHPTPFIERGYHVNDGLKLLHAEDTAGQMHIAVRAFLLIWRHLPGPWPLLARLVGWPPLLALAEPAYRRFAAWRYARLGYDQCAL